MLVVHRRFVVNVLRKASCTVATNYLVLTLQPACSVDTSVL